MDSQRRLRELIDLAKDGDREALTVLWQIVTAAVRVPFLTTVRRFGIPSGHAEDLRQDFYLHLFGKPCRIGQFRGGSPSELTAFLCKVLVNFVHDEVDHWRVERARAGPQREREPLAPESLTEARVQSTFDELESIATPADRKRFRALRQAKLAESSADGPSAVRRRTPRCAEALFRRYSDRVI
jgi:hypothetical protein